MRTGNLVRNIRSQKPVTFDGLASTVTALKIFTAYYHHKLITNIISLSAVIDLGHTVEIKILLNSDQNQFINQKTKSLEFLNQRS